MTAGSTDPRGRRIAVVADSLLGPLLDELGALALPQYAIHPPSTSRLIPET